MKNKYFTEVNIAKGIGISLVILGHCFHTSSGIVPSGLPKIIMQVIYSFHMPLFFFLSGLLGHKILKNDKIEFGYLKKKAIRLLVPYFVCGVLYSVLYLCASSFVKVSNNHRLDWKILFGINPNYELWFLYVLFVFFLISILFVRKNNIIPTIIISLLLAIGFGFLSSDGYSLLNVLAKILKNSVFFFAGMICGIDYDKIAKFLKMKCALISLCCFAASNVALYYQNNRLLKNAICVVAAFSGIAFCVAVSKLISKQRLSVAFNTMGINSMGIFIVSGFIQPMIKVVLNNKLKISYSLTVILCFVATLILSILCVFIIKKIKIARLLLFGEK